MSAPLTKEQQLKHNKKIKLKKVSKAELKKRVEFLLSKEVCQVCNFSTDLDYPHHTLFGLAKKDDRSMINICVSCHREIHTKGFPVHGLNREDMIEIGRLNNEEFLSEGN